jgi:HK97 family phage prohead protease
MDRTSLLELDSRATVRDFAGQDLDLRAADADSSELLFEGYSCITQHYYDMFGGPPNGWYERILTGAFKKTLSEGADVVLLVNHAGAPLARTAHHGLPGTMTLTEDTQGEHVLARLDPTDPDVQALRPKLERKDLNEMSFAFRIVRQVWHDQPDDLTPGDPATAPYRSIVEINQNKGDVSIVNYGANHATFGGLRALDVALRALRTGHELDREQQRDIARLLADELPAGGMSLRLARAYADAARLRTPHAA